MLPVKLFVCISFFSPLSMGSPAVGAPVSPSSQGCLLVWGCPQCWGGCAVPMLCIPPPGQSCCFCLPGSVSFPVWASTSLFMGSINVQPAPLPQPACLPVLISALQCSAPDALNSSVWFQLQLC